MAGTFVDITREDFEDWLDTLPSRGRWFRNPRYKGIYIVPLSETVGVSIRSTVGEGGIAKGRGNASGAITLVSLQYGHTLNRKAQGQSHFARTTNWRDNWRKGFDRQVEAYKKSPDFYEVFAGIEDRVKYREEIMKDIEKHPDWEENDLLISFHDRVKDGGFLTKKQLAAMEGILRQKQAPSKNHDPDTDLLNNLRLLWQAASRARNQWLMDFTKSVGQQVKAGRSLSPKQLAIVNENLTTYKIR